MSGDNVNSFKSIGGSNEYGGMVYVLKFDRPPTDTELSAAVHTFDDCPFGWRIQGRNKEIVTIKIHND
jgi:hypothetical protein